MLRKSLFTWYGSSTGHLAHPNSLIRTFQHNVRKCTFGHVRPAKFQISLCIRAVWSESSLSAFWIAKDVKFLPVDNKDWSVSTDARADLNLLWARVRRHGFYLAAPLIHRTASINSVSGQWWVYPLAWVVLNIHCRNMPEDFSFAWLGSNEPSGHTTWKWRRIIVDATWSRRIDVDTTSLWCCVPAGKLHICRNFGAMLYSKLLEK